MIQLKVHTTFWRYSIAKTSVEIIIIEDQNRFFHKTRETKKTYVHNA